MSGTDVLKFAGLFALVFGGAYVVMGSRAPDHDPLVRGTAAATTQTVVASTLPTSQPATTQAATNPTDAQIQRTRKALHALFAEMRLRRDQFDGQMESLQLDRLLDAKILSDPDTYVPARGDLRAARSIILSYESDLDRMAVSIPTRFKSAGVTREFQLDTIVALNDAPIIQKYYWRQAVLVERDRVDRLTKLLDFVGPRLSHLSIRGGALICDDPSDDAKLLDQLRALAANRQKRQKFDSNAWFVLEDHPAPAVSRFDLNVP